MRPQRIDHLVLLASFVGATASCGDTGCGDRVVQDVLAPDGRQHAVVFVRDCGATTDFSTQVSVLPAGRAVSGGGNAFVADADHGRAPRARDGGPAVTVRWLSPQQVEIGYDRRARTFKTEHQLGKTTIAYRVDSTAAIVP